MPAERISTRLGTFPYRNQIKINATGRINATARICLYEADQSLEGRMVRQRQVTHSRKYRMRLVPPSIALALGGIGSGIRHVRLHLARKRYRRRPVFLWPPYSR